MIVKKQKCLSSRMWINQQQKIPRQISSGGFERRQAQSPLPVPAGRVGLCVNALGPFTPVFTRQNRFAQPHSSTSSLSLSLTLSVCLSLTPPLSLSHSFRVVPAAHGADSLRIAQSSMYSHLLCHRCCCCSVKPGPSHAAGRLAL